MQRSHVATLVIRSLPCSLIESQRHLDVAASNLVVRTRKIPQKRRKWSPWRYRSIAFKCGLGRVSKLAYEANIWRPLEIYRIWNMRGYLGYNPCIIDYSGTPPPYFNKRNKTDYRRARGWDMRKHSHKAGLRPKYRFWGGSGMIGYRPRGFWRCDIPNI